MSRGMAGEGLCLAELMSETRGNRPPSRRNPDKLPF